MEGRCKKINEVHCPSTKVARRRSSV
ncbi:hypothetical protein CCACVL1_04749 [Corchorus capsularis]|uniref:Uncharacterized protein n=1 Tax=Corchorus capsularis TaxID=210143 RepID=A0A1R3JPX8_COCAP|nr:hypothetical protein CCACVL1_04749 [Corchorus capsularis]